MALPAMLDASQDAHAVGAVGFATGRRLARTRIDPAHQSIAIGVGWLRAGADGELTRRRKAGAAALPPSGRRGTPHAISAFSAITLANT